VTAVLLGIAVLGGVIYASTQRVERRADVGAEAPAVAATLGL
jgi:hypothetical protein